MRMGGSGCAQPGGRAVSESDRISIDAVRRLFSLKVRASGDTLTSYALYYIIDLATLSKRFS